jgi:hypothetical protein
VRVTRREMEAHTAEISNRRVRRLWRKSSREQHVQPVSTTDQKLQSPAAPMRHGAPCLRPTTLSAMHVDKRRKESESEIRHEPHDRLARAVDSKTCMHGDANSFPPEHTKHCLRNDPRPAHPSRASNDEIGTILGSKFIACYKSDGHVGSPGRVGRWESTLLRPGSPRGTEKPSRHHSIGSYIRMRTREKVRDSRGSFRYEERVEHEFLAGVFEPLRAIGILYNVSRHGRRRFDAAS